MSIISCFFIFLLFLSKESSCKARHIGVRQKGIFAADHFHYSGSKGVEKVQLQIDLAQGGMTKGDMNRNPHDKGHAGATSEETVESSKSGTWLKELLKYRRGTKSGGALKKRPLVYVSWRVPSKNQDNKNHKGRDPGFFSDYSRPRTRPPSHN